MTVELWIDQEYFQSIYDGLDKDKIVIRSVFDDEVKEQLKYHYKQIQKLKIDGITKEKDKRSPDKA